jgi:fructose-bisphosphate aldolase class I
VPIVEPEVLMSGSHLLSRCEEVTAWVLHRVFDALFDQRVRMEGVLLKPSMVIPGSECAERATVDEVAAATVRTLARHVPPAVPGVVFLSGGQGYLLATEHLAAIVRRPDAKPWTMTFSYGRALLDEALGAWGGKTANVRAGQRAFHHRVKCASAAALGSYTSAMEREAA